MVLVHPKEPERWGPASEVRSMAGVSGPDLTNGTEEFTYLDGSYIYPGSQVDYKKNGLYR